MIKKKYHDISRFSIMVFSSCFLAVTANRSTLYARQPARDRYSYVGSTHGYIHGQDVYTVEMRVSQEIQTSSFQYLT